MKTAVVTGASEGLGYQAAKQLTEKGYKVIGLSRTKPDLNIEHSECDLTEEENIKMAANTVDKVDILINCAGILNVEDIDKLDYQTTEKLIRLNVIAPLILSSALLPKILESEGDIVFIGSTVGFKAYEKQAAYGASKWAVRGIVNNFQMELKATKCRVIGFNPGGFKSRIFEKATGEKLDDWTGWMDPADLAKFMIQILELPKNMEVSEVVINRK